MIFFLSLFFLPTHSFFKKKLMPLNRNKTHLQFYGFSSHGRAFSTERPHPALPGYVRSPSSTMRVPRRFPLPPRRERETFTNWFQSLKLRVADPLPTRVCFIILTLNSRRVSCPGSDLFARKAVIFQKQPVSCPPRPPPPPPQDNR